MNAVEQAEKTIATYDADVVVPAPDIRERGLGRDLQFALRELLAEHRRVLAERKPEVDADTLGNAIFAETTMGFAKTPAGLARAILARFEVRER